MRIKLSEFPYQPGTLKCCSECAKISSKDCQPHPMNCIDFYIANKNFIDSKLAYRREKDETRC